MYLQALKLKFFKNYTDRDFKFVKGVNFITGPNASGKTNVLDAIYMLSFTKSYFNLNDSSLINFMQEKDHGAGFFLIEGQYLVNDSPELIRIVYDKNRNKEKRKIIQRNSKAYERFSDHIGLIPLIMIAPYDVSLILGGSEERRKFIDILISQFDKEYLNALISYNKALKNRNILLKQIIRNGQYVDRMLFASWDAQLIKYGNIIYEMRKNITNDLIELFNKYYYKIAGTDDKIKINYTSQLESKTMEELLKDNFEKDKEMLYTTVGIHKDDIVFVINDMKMKKIASQGQQKTLLIALKLAEREIIKKFSGKTPILLLDDVFDKLDEIRVSKMIKELDQDDDGQIFITDTHTERMLNIKKSLVRASLLYEIIPQTGEVKNYV